MRTVSLVDSPRVSMTLDRRTARIVDALADLGHLPRYGRPGDQARETLAWALVRLIRSDPDLASDVGDAMRAADERRKAERRVDPPRRSRDEVRASLRVVPGGRT
jgi:hypothetical protein